MSGLYVVQPVQPSTFLDSRFVPESLSSTEEYWVDLGEADFRYYHTLDCSTHENERPSDQYAEKRPDEPVRGVGLGTIVLCISFASIII